MARGVFVSGFVCKSFYLCFWHRGRLCAASLSVDKRTSTWCVHLVLTQFCLRKSTTLSCLCLYFFFKFYWHCCQAPSPIPHRLPLNTSTPLLDSLPPLTYLFRKSWVTASCTRQARPLLLDTKWRVSVLSLSNIIAKASGWFAFICRQASNIQVQVHTHTHSFHIFLFLWLLIQFDRCLFRALWVVYIASSVDRDSTVGVNLIEKHSGPDKLINHQKRQLVRAAGRDGSVGTARSFLLDFSR